MAKPRLAIILILLLVIGCDSKEVVDLHKYKISVKLVGLTEDVEPSLNGITIHQMTFESCEYLLVRRANEVSITHKGNCSNPTHLARVVWQRAEAD